MSIANGRHLSASIVPMHAPPPSLILLLGMVQDAITTFFIMKPLILDALAKNPRLTDHH